MKWQGQTGVDGDGYLIFKHPKWGIRAGARIFWSYKYHHGIDTIQGAIRRWAPPQSNPTDQYIAYVAKCCGVTPTLPIDFCKYAFQMITAVIFFENGVQPYPASIIEDGITLAHIL